MGTLSCGMPLSAVRLRLSSAANQQFRDWKNRQSCFECPIRLSLCKNSVPGLANAGQSRLLRSPEALGKRQRKTSLQPYSGQSSGSGRRSEISTITSGCRSHCYVFLPNAQIGVLELGMNHAGEIRSLTQIAQPQIGVVTNIGHAHIEAFESIEGIAQAKRELIEGLPAASTAVLNADDSRVLAFSAYAKDKVITYGTAEHAHVRAEDLKLTPQGSEFTCSGARFHTSLTGRHGILNILAGLAMASVFNIDFEHLIDPVSRLVPAKMRGERSVKGGITILDDSYNSNPDAVRSMIDVLRNETAKRRIAVLGEMLELGRWADALHRDVGSYAADAEIDVVVGISGATRSLVQAIETAHGSRTEAYFFRPP